jgi:hypothetical protein
MYMVLFFFVCGVVVVWMHHHKPLAITATQQTVVIHLCCRNLFYLLLKCPFSNYKIEVCLKATFESRDGHRGVLGVKAVLKHESPYLWKF